MGLKNGSQAVFTFILSLEMHRILTFFCLLKRCQPRTYVMQIREVNRKIHLSLFASQVVIKTTSNSCDGAEAYWLDGGCVPNLIPDQLYSKRPRKLVDRLYPIHCRRKTGKQNGGHLGKAHFTFKYVESGLVAQQGFTYCICRVRCRRSLMWKAAGVFCAHTCI